MSDKSELAVKYQNELNLVPLKNFNAKQMDLFFALCARMKDKGVENIRFSFEELKELSDYKMTATKAFVADLEKLYKDMLNLSYRTENDDEIEYFVLFNGFKIDKKQKFVEVRVNQDLDYIINGLTTEFSRFELSAFTSIRSTYAKTLFRLLMQYRSTGYYVVSIEDFRELLDIPEYYQMGNIDQKVLKPAMKELHNYFENLEVTKIKAKKGNKIAKLEFTFTGLKTVLLQSFK
ncbi:RepB family plasmid replication initiator protein [Enterococcus faecalis]|uniref:replication initiation protein n=2 Tax=Enterococcus faecalis TaxID=1351 RepID=UPI001C1F392B|nr:replication initiation protein [Enterococcus faecalis]MCE2553606.1 RepB family plasmid replication initiator protein [Enterococcus faecalis]QWW18377.1 replication initiation protein [Enterococcus faecalis]